MTQIKFHPLADMFPLMEGEEFDALVADIKTHKLREKIILYDGMILDGRNRYRALVALGADLKTIRECCEAPCCIDNHHGGPTAYVISANIHRRHLNAEQKREIIAKLIKADPSKSDRQIAKQAKVDHKTVGAARVELEGRGEIPHVEERTDTKGRKQPTKKRKTSGDVEEIETENPDQIVTNFLDTVGRHAAVLRAYKKVFGVSALTQEQKDEVRTAIGRLITKWPILGTGADAREECRRTSVT
jgi:ParB-like chromosome segregation protein Spo0J